MSMQRSEPPLDPPAPLGVRPPPTPPRASGTVFGPLQEEMDRLDAILDLGVPTGLVVGEERMVSRVELPLLRRFAFLDAYLTNLPLYLYAAGVPVVPAIPHDYPAGALSFLRALPGEWAEAAR